MEIDAALLAQVQAAKEASRKLAGLSTETKNRALEAIADSLLARQDEVLAANAQDVESARDAGLADAPLNRLRLTPEKIAAIAADVRSVALLSDPVGEVIDGRRLPNGLRVSRRRGPGGGPSAPTPPSPASPARRRRRPACPRAPCSSLSAPTAPSSANCSRCATTSTSSCRAAAPSSSASSPRTPACPSSRAASD